MKQTIEILIKRWINTLNECEDCKKDFIIKNINQVKREMRYALKIMEQQEREGNNNDK